MEQLKNLKLNDFPATTYDKLRYGDTDKQGHVNNAVFTTFYETGRVEIVYRPENGILDDGCSFVIANLQMNFIREIHWPGKLYIGTGITKVGNSSITFVQALYQNDQLVSTSRSVLVQVSNDTKKSVPLSDAAKKRLQPYIINL